MKESKLYLRKRVLIRKIRSITDFLRGSIVELKRPCTYPNCQKCQKGIKHSAVYYSVTVRGKTKLVYLRRGIRKKTKRMIKNYRLLKVLIDELSLVNLKIMLVEFKKQKGGVKWHT